METLGPEKAELSGRPIHEEADWLAVQEALRFDNTTRRRDSQQLLSDLDYLANNGNETAATLLAETSMNSPWIIESEVAINGLVNHSGTSAGAPKISEETGAQISDILESIYSEYTEEEALTAIGELDDQLARMMGFNLLSQQLKQRIN